jgi:hypothetical protein
MKTQWLIKMRDGVANHRVWRKATAQRQPVRVAAATGPTPPIQNDSTGDPLELIG